MASKVTPGKKAVSWANLRTTREQAIFAEGQRVGLQEGVKRGISFARLRIVASILEEAGSLFSQGGSDERAKLTRELAHWVNNLEVVMKEG